jgi:hypothetical protein
MIGSLENRTDGRAFEVGGEDCFVAGFGIDGWGLETREDVESEMKEVEGLPPVPTELRLEQGWSLDSVLV